MPRGVHLLLAMGVALGLLVAAPAAPPGSATVPPPPPTPGTVGPPQPDINFAVDDGLPPDFHFTGRVDGYGMTPGERFIITVRNVAATPQTVAAGGDGEFHANISFTWVFCGAHATRQPPPVIVATGSQGTYTTTLPAHHCPLLWAFINQAASAKLASASPSAPWTLPYEVEAFGFGAGEHVTLREVLPPELAGIAPPSPLHSAANAQGALQLRTPMNLPADCTFAVARPELALEGDEGTAVASSLYWDAYSSPACPANLPPVSGPPPPPPAAPPPPPPDGSTPLAINLQPMPAHAGHVERAAIQAASATTIRLLVRYPHGRTMRRTVAIGSSGWTTVRWRLSRSVHAGIAHVQLTAEPGGASLQAAFRVR